MVKQLIFNDLLIEERDVIAASEKAVNLSYSPYSGIKVGAAALLSDGTIVTGANQESPSFPVGLCAERSLLFSVMNKHDRSVVKILAVSAVKNGESIEISPCGICRQTILDMETRQNSPIKIIFRYDNHYTAVTSAQDLLPFSFSSI